MARSADHYEDHGTEMAEIGLTGGAFLAYRHASLEKV